MSGGHTPGPWSVNGYPVEGPNLETICIVGVMDDYGYCYSRVPNDEANGRLIAAAPDLLVALQQIISSGHAISQPLRWEAEAAIAKATGAA